VNGYLTARDIGAEWTRTESWRSYSSAAELLDLVTAYMTSKGIGTSRVIDKLDVVEHVLRLHTQATERPQRVQTPEENWLIQQRESFGDDQRRIDREPCQIRAWQDPVRAPQRCRQLTTRGDHQP
jgi:hypothetical protein